MAQTSNREASACPNEEALLGYLLDSTSDGEIGRHVNGCDRCVASLRVAHARLQLDADVDVRVPAAIRDRAAANPAAERRLPALSRWQEAVARFTDALRLPFLVPMAAAALLLLVVGLPGQRGDLPPSEATRDVQLRQQARVTVPSATLHREPSASAEGLASVGRGTTLLLMDEQDGWLQVELLDGTAGWMEKHAFE